MTSLREPFVNDIIVSHIHSGMKALYKESLRLNANDSIIFFQESLRKIKDLSQINLEDEYERFTKRVEDEGNDEEFIDRIFDLTFRNIMKYFMEADKGYVVEDMRKLPSSYLNMPKDNVRLLYLITLESARGIYTKSNLYCTKYSQADIQANYDKAKNIIQNSVIKAVKNRLDLDEIFDYYNKPVEEEEKINTDFYKYVTNSNTDVPDRLNWQKEDEEKIKSIHYDPEEKIEDEDEEDDEEDDDE